jgi:hypothetical protein
VSRNPEIRRRSVSDSLRWLASKLESDTLTEADRTGVAVTLHALADDLGLPPCDAHGDAPNSSGQERCELPAGHDGRHRDGISSWPRRGQPHG